METWLFRNYARRQAAGVIQNERALTKLFETIGERYQGRNGGYTRITKLDYRVGDGAPLAAVELVGAEVSPEGAAKRGKKQKQSVSL
ncbi:MAG: bL17 family ribosomal protein [Candidatus Methylomirabilales bacterium]